MKFIRLCLLAVVLAHPALADPYFYNASRSPVTIEVTLPNGSVVSAGYSASTPLPTGVVMMSLLGTPTTVDMVGVNGVGAVRGAVIGGSFDEKKMIPLSPEESLWVLSVKQADGTMVKAENIINPARYVVVWLDSAGKYRTASLGSIKP